MNRRTRDEGAWVRRNDTEPPRSGDLALSSTPEGRRALFRVVRGTPTDAELAALTVVLAALAAAPRPEPRPAPTTWNDPAARLRRPPTPGPGAWRTSLWPR